MVKVAALHDMHKSITMGLSYLCAGLHANNVEEPGTNDISRYATGRMTIEETAKRIKISADKEIGFDVYQLCAFYYLNDTGNGEYWRVLKQAILCSFVQFPIILGLTYEFYSASEKQFCDLHEKEDDYARIIRGIFAGLLSLFVALQMSNKKYDVIRSGMYCVCIDRTNAPDNLAGSWLVFGKLYNGLVFQGATALCVCVIFSAETMLDMVLNSVALLFLVDMDNMFVTSRDYKIISMAFENYRPIREKVKEDDSSLIAWSCLRKSFELLIIIEYILFHSALLAAPILITFCY